MIRRASGQRPGRISNIGAHAVALGALLAVVGCPDPSGPERERDAAEAPEDGAVADDASAPLDAIDVAEPDGGDAEVALARLSQSGLYADLGKGTLAPGVQSFAPDGALWSDGADKQRWVYLPPGTRIDSSNMDAWKLPVGTKLWKEFSLAGKRLETRLLEKTSASSWTMVAFQWNAEQTDAMALPEGAKNVAGTQHDIPSDKDCQRCHEGVADTAIGFSAVLLAHSGAGLTLAGLVQAGLLSHPPSAIPRVPGTADEQKTLRYLHANCGNCHNDRTFISNVTDVDYFLKLNTLAAVDQTNAHRTVQRDLRKAGSVEKTAIIQRMRFRGIQGQMPPIASEQVDTDGVALVQAWVGQLFATRDAGVADAGAGDAGTSDGGLVDAQ